MSPIALTTELPGEDIDSTENDTEPTKPYTTERQFEPEFQKIDTFNMMMDSGLVSCRTGHFASEFEGKAFSRIIPSYTVKQKTSSNKGEHLLPSVSSSIPSQDNNTSEFAQNATPTDDAHTYLRNDIDITWNRTPFLCSWEVPTKRQSPRINSQEDNSKILFLCLYEKIHEGTIWDVFSGDMGLRDRTGIPQPIVLKLTKLNLFLRDIPESIGNWNSDFNPLRTTVRDNIINEDYLLRQHLKSLQGDVVPYYYGMFVWHEKEEEDEEDWMIAMIMEDVGNPIECEMRSFPFDMKKEILHCFSRIREEARVIHYQLDSRHILERVPEDRQQFGRFVIVDFKESERIAKWKKIKREKAEKREVKLLYYLFNLKENGSGQIEEREYLPE